MNNIKQRTALIIGSTGITGLPLLKLLCDSDQYSKVISFSRRKPSFQHPKLTSHVVDFEAVNHWQHLLIGDDLFSALGTTRKQAGSTQAQYRIDHDYQVNVIKAAAHQNTRRLFLVSSPNADSSSRWFYPRMKGEIENAVKPLPFESHIFIRPSIIVGNRPDSRLGETAGAWIVNSLRAVTKIVPINRLRRATDRLQPVSGEELAYGILKIAERQLPSGVSIFEFDQIPR